MPTRAGLGLQQQYKIGVTHEAFKTLQVVTERPGHDQFGNPMSINVPVAPLLNGGPPVDTMVSEYFAKGSKRKKLDPAVAALNATNNTPAVSGVTGAAAAAAAAESGSKR